MPDGNNMQSGPDQGGQNQQVPQTSGPNLNNSGMSPIGEGWGTGSASFDEAVENIKKFFGAFKGDVMTAWLVFAGIGFLLQTLEVGVEFFTWLLSSATGGIGSIFGLLGIPVAILVGLGSVVLTAGQLSLYGPMREKMFHGIEPGSWNAALKTGMGRIMPVTLSIVAIAVIIPLTCVIPGLIIAFFAIMAPYLLASRQDLGVIDAFKRSYELAKKYWQVFALTIGGLFVAGLAAGCIVGIGSALYFLPEPLGMIGGSYASWAAVTAFQFGIFVVWGGVFSTVDAHESGETLG